MTLSPLRVVLALESSGPGGAENMVLHLAGALRRGGDEPMIATMRSGWMTQRAEAAGIPVWVVPQRPGVDLAWVLGFARRLRRNRIDVLHTHDFGMNIFGGTAALLARTRAISTLYKHRRVADRPSRALAYRVLHRLGIPIVAVSQDLASFVVDRLNLRSVEVIRNGIPLPPAVSGTSC